MSVRWAFIGAGRHVQLWIAPAVERATNGQAVGVWSRQPEHAAEVAARHGIPRVYTALDEVLADPEVDAVFIATPNHLHARQAIAALRAGKHVLIEKPMAVGVDEAAAAVRAAREAGRLLGVGFHFRHHTLIAEARQQVAAGMVGDVLYATAQFNLTSSPPPRLTIAHAPWKRDPEQMGGAGALMGMGVHLIDLLRCMTGQEVAAVSAVAGGMTAEQPLESFGQALLEFEGGAHGHILYGGRFPLSRNDLVVYGSAGRLVAEGAIDVATGGTLQLTRPAGATGWRAETARPELTDHYQGEVEAFSRAVATGTPFAADGVDGLRTVEVAAAIIEAHRSGRRVRVERTEV